MSRYRILILPPFFPFPPNDGGKICVFGFIDSLRKLHEFHLLVPIRTYDEEEQLKKLTLAWPEVVIHTVIETPAKSKNHFLKKLFPNKSFLNPFRNVLQKLKRKPYKNPYDFYENANNSFPFSPLNARYIAELKKIISSYQFDIIQTELTPMLNLVHFFRTARAKKIFVQIESREEVIRDYGNNNSIDQSFSNYVVSNAAFHENNLMSLYDAVFALNEGDRKIISQRCPITQVFNSPFAVLDSQVIKVDANGYDPLHFIFIGGENHFPNYDGLKWFLKEVLPICKSEKPTLFVTGHWQEATKREFSKYYSKIRFVGFQNDLTNFLSNSISIVPIRIGGGGMRTKVLFSMANSTPVVTTSLGAVGIEGENNTHFLIADTAAAFAESISFLLNDARQARKIIQNASQLIKSNYSQGVVAERRNNYYHQIMNL